jgi:uncharacterized protein
VRVSVSNEASSGEIPVGSAPSERNLTLPDERPRPVVTPLTEPYWTAARDCRLVVQHCSGCDAFTHFPADACSGCGESSELVWREVSGAGHVYTFTVVHRAAVPGFKLPYAIAWIDLVEGPRVFGGVLNCAPDEVRIGMPVTVVFEERAGFGPVPTFSAAAER